MIRKPIQVFMSPFQPITKSSNDQNNDVVALEIVMFYNGEACLWQNHMIEVILG